jgi:hypothetical protein
MCHPNFDRHGEVFTDDQRSPHARQAIELTGILGGLDSALGNVVKELHDIRL